MHSTYKTVYNALYSSLLFTSNISAALMAHFLVHQEIHFWLSFTSTRERAKDRGVGVLFSYLEAVIWRCLFQWTLRQVQGQCRDYYKGGVPMRTLYTSLLNIRCLWGASLLPLWCSTSCCVGGHFVACYVAASNLSVWHFFKKQKWNLINTHKNTDMLKHVTLQIS